MKIFTKSVSLICLIALLSGCAVYLADVQGLRKIKAAHVKVFDKDLPGCYELTEEALARWKAAIFQKHRGDYIIAIQLESAFKTCIDTTELAIFFKEVAPHKTEVKVTSLDYHLAEFIAGKLFVYIEKDGKVSPEEDVVLSSPSTGRNFWKS